MYVSKRIFITSQWQNDSGGSFPSICTNKHKPLASQVTRSRDVVCQRISLGQGRLWARWLTMIRALLSFVCLLYYSLWPAILVVPPSLPCRHLIAHLCLLYHPLCLLYHCLQYTILYAWRMVGWAPSFPGGFHRKLHQLQLAGHLRPAFLLLSPHKTSYPWQRRLKLQKLGRFRW